MGCASSSPVAKHGGPVTAAVKRDPVCTDVEVPQPCIEEEDESRDLLMPLPSPTLLTSKGAAVTEGKMEKDEELRSVEEEGSVSSAAESRARFTISGVDVRPFLPKVLPTSTVLGALCMMWVQLPALHVNAPTQAFVFDRCRSPSMWNRACPDALTSHGSIRFRFCAMTIIANG
ncbi:unnamed protein product [Symbiodinium sp. CCMP2592]|nr:unnamed protein product [Symbiodinium sp. CCMP2592]